MSALLKTEKTSDLVSELTFNSETAVLIDTNGFMIPVQFGIDIFSELQRLGFSEFLTVPAVIFELQKLSKIVKGNDKMAARVALSLSRKCKILESIKGEEDVSAKSGKHSEKYADDVIIEAAVQNSLTVLTNDAGLRQKLMNKGIRVVSMRQTNRLDFISQK